MRWKQQGGANIPNTTMKKDIKTMSSLSSINNNLANVSWSSRFAVLTLVWLIGLVFVTAYLVYYYPVVFNSDSAAIQVLAQAMADEMSLLPHDFSYGNQLILFRANLFIAPVLKLGLTGYNAYVVGSAINFSVFFLITFLTLETLYRQWTKSLFLTVLFFLPLGFNEAEFMLGQQSHLANVVFILMIAVHSYRACWHKEWRGLVIASSVVFLMTLETPMRVLFVLLPLALVIATTGKARSAGKLSLALVIAFVVGYIGNRYLVMTHPIAADFSNMPFTTSDRLVIRVGEMLKDFVDGYIGFSQFIGMQTKPRVHLVLYGLKTLVLVSFLGLFYWLAKRLAERALKPWMDNSGTIQGEPQAMEFIGMLGITGVLTGLWMNAAIELYPEGITRHFLWALQLCKLALCAYTLNALAYLIPKPLPRYGVLFVLALLSSTVASSFLFAPYRTQLHQNIESKTNLPIDGKIQELMLIHGINSIYSGDFWNALRLEVLIPPAKAAELSVSDGSVFFRQWLTRPSMRCIDGNVFYLLDRSKINEEFIARRVLERGGRILEHFGDTGIYLGTPVWDRNGCIVSYLEIIPKPDTHHTVGKFDTATNVMVAEKGQVGALMFGPYAKLAPGHYQATLLVTAEAGIDGTDVGAVDVNGVAGATLGHQLVSVPIKAARGEQTIKLTFDVNDQQIAYEFRVIVNGKGSRMSVKGVLVEKL